MKKISEKQIRRGRNCVFLLHVHLVFVTKYRKKIFSQKYLVKMEKIFKEVCSSFSAELEEFNGEQDHVHLLVNYLPKISISKLVNSLKGVSSRILRRDYQEIEKYYWKGGLWSPSYFAGSCGGAKLSIIKRYIEKQATPE